MEVDPLVSMACAAMTVAVEIVPCLGDYATATLVQTEMIEDKKQDLTELRCFWHNIRASLIGSDNSGTKRVRSIYLHCYLS